MTPEQQAIERLKSDLSKVNQEPSVQVSAPALRKALAHIDQLTEANRELVDTGLAAASKLNWYASSEGDIADHLAAIARHKPI